MIFEASVVAAALGIAMLAKRTMKTTPKGSPGKSSSPIKRDKTGMSVRSGGARKKKAKIPTLTVRAFKDPIPIEAYIYSKDENHDGFLHPIRNHLRNEGHTLQVLTDLGIANMVPRRVPGTDNEIMENGAQRYWRLIIIRGFDGNGMSTAETRQEGLETLKQLFMSNSYSSWPPPNIVTSDETNEEDPAPLDDFFLDNEIQQYMEENIQAAVLNANFYEEHHEIAVKCWSNPTSLMWAHERGFPAIVPTANGDN